MSSVTFVTRAHHRLWNLPLLWTLKNAPTAAWKTREPFSTAPTGIDNRSFHIRLDTLRHRVALASCPRGELHSAPNQAFVVQAIRTLSNAIDGVLSDGCVLICDRDRKWSSAVLAFLEQEGVRIVQMLLREPNCNAYAERFVRSIRRSALRDWGSGIFDARSPSSSPTTMPSGIIKASATS